MTRNGFAERYQVGCASCHELIGYYPTADEAREVARMAASASHLSCDIGIIVYDRMAHWGQPHIWRPGGTCIAWKSR